MFHQKRIYSGRSYTDDQENLLIQVSDSLRKWLKRNGLEGYLGIADVEPHPLVVEIVKEIDVDKSSNQQVDRFLNLKNEGYNMMESLETEVLESYFGPYSPSAKSYGGKRCFLS